ncbi:MAG TPA: glycerophosphodiester phosphodiesterase family protein [Stellaceae bacterium]|nr:glycerophosphodiester phosphodiesterase family protein [Stellaceae bacterium]
MTGPIVIGHRGARGLLPENTLPAFARAIALGADGIELDVAVTADRVPVVSHHPRLNPDITRAPDGAWLEPPTPLIRELRFAEVREFDVGRIRPDSRYAGEFPFQEPVDGAPIPSLAEVFALDRTIRLYIEMKTFPTHPELAPPPEEMAELVAAAIVEAEAAARVVVLSLDWRGLRYLRRRHPSLATGWLTQSASAPQDRLLWHESPFRFPAKTVAREGGSCWLPEFAELSERRVAKAHRQGIPVIPWELRRPGEIVRAIDWGADGLIVDRPDLALEIRRLKSPEGEESRRAAQRPNNSGCSIG